MASGARETYIWDLPIRLFHWGLVILVVISWITAQIGGNAMTYHMWSGYTILALLIFRVGWGFIGGHHARFASFLNGPTAVIGYARGLMRRSDTAKVIHYLGHNPLGGWSVIAMIAALLLQVGTGLFANDDIATEGPLARLVSKATSDYLSKIHHLNINVLYVLIGLHLAAILFYLFVKRDNLIRPMLVGTKAFVEGDSATAPEGRGSTLAAVVVFALAVLAVYFITARPAV